MRKRGKKLLAMTLALSMSMNVVGFQAFADEISEGNPTVTEGTVSVETQKGEEEAVDVLISVNQKEDGTIETKTETPEGGSVTTGGSLVKLEGTEITSSDGSVIESKTEYDVQKGRYHAEGGSETTLEDKAPEVKVDVPLTDIDKPETEKVENKNTVKDEDKVGESDVIDKSETSETTDTVVNQGSVTITTNKVEVEEEFTGEMDMDYIHGDPIASKENELLEYNPGPTGQVDPNTIQVKDGYSHVYMGTSNYSKYAVALLWREGAAGEEPIYIDKDGTPYYLGAGKNAFESRGLYIDHYYGDGEAQGEKAYARWDFVQQFVFVDAATGELITTYCADQKTTTQGGYSYIMENVEDADYYEDDQAEMIRSIAMNGYWGTESGFGSLDEMKQKLIASGKFTKEELNSLTDGVAMTATQFAIWSFSNKNNGDKYVGAYHVGDKVVLSNGTGDIHQITDENDKKDVDLIFKIYNHLISLAPTSVNNTTADTIINADNFVKDLSVTVIDKAEDHANNQDDDDTNDAYVTDLTFALVVTPSTENGDDLVVKVLDAQGNEIASARIAGENKEGETYNYLTPDTNGNYIFDNITLTEGTQNFNITMEGIQNLKEGVYLYTSEVRTAADGSETSSQTMVGVASGERGVNVSMNISFDLSVEDEVVAREHVWRTEWNEPSGDGGNDGGGGGSNTRIIEETPVPLADTIEIGDSDVPLSDGVLNIEDSQIPLAVLPMTGDVSVIWMLISLISGLSLAGVSFVDRKKSK